ncbi:ABC transporter ATP-binding protein [Nocardia sp. NPDC058058]|uniref:ABC transporter ATP-binding protein n=1 Tax=Nocardia sp. NPDC058058 TaxID=3346317 RepID=UPI0036DF637E
MRIENVSKTYGSGRTATSALDQVSLTVRHGEFVCLLGASGCGKSTLLSMIAGLDTPTSGAIDTCSARVGLVFQDPALFPWLTVAGNIAVALRAAGVPKAARAQRITELLRIVRLEGSGDRRPHQLSGGMRQRAAIARALAQDSEILLLDEPFAALDAMTRDLLHDELERIWRERALSTVFVTHNVREAVRLGDRVILLSSRPGRVIEEYEVPLARPRRIDSPEVAVLAAHITDRLRAEVGRYGRG